MNNPVAYNLEPKEPLCFLLIGVLHHFNRRLGRETAYEDRLWSLNIYSSDKTRRIAMRKMKRENSDVICVEWDMTMEQIVKDGRLVFPMASEKVLASDKLDIFEQLWRSQRGRQF